MTDVTYDTATSAEAGVQISVTTVHTRGANANIALIGAMNRKAPPRTVVSVTYDGNACTVLEDNAIGNQRTVLYYYLNPPAGAKNVTITWNGDPQYQAIGCVTLNDCDPADPVDVSGGATGNDGNGKVTVPSAVGDMVVDAFGEQNIQDPLAGAGQTERVEEFAANGGLWMSTEAGAAPNVEMSWTHVAVNWAIGAVSVKAAPAGNPWNAYAQQ